MALGRQGQQHLEEAFDLENQVWTPQHTAKIANHLSRQQEVSCLLLLRSSPASPLFSLPSLSPHLLSPPLSPDLYPQTLNSKR